MQSSPNRERVINMGCPRCDITSIRVVNGVATKDYARVPSGHSEKRHGKTKPKGIHAYRRGAVR